MTDFRALCAELIEIIEDHCNPDEYALPDVVNVLNRARALLAQPEPQGPTEMEIIAFWSEHCAGDGDAGILRLARFGRPAIEPVPVSWRLPGPEDCDAEGRCWIGTWNHIEDEDVFELLFDWSFTSPRDWTWSGIAHIQYWLPHWALPVPGVEGEP
jgi:hypothetical protein